MKSLITTIAVCALSVGAFSQSMKQIAKNQVSEDMVVYTYSLEDVTSNGAVLSDTEATKAGVSNQNEYTAHFRTIEGVSEATFDATTNTVTVYTDPKALLPAVINLEKQEK